MHPFIAWFGVPEMALNMPRYTFVELKFPAPENVLIVVVVEA